MVSVQPEFTRCKPFATERLQIATPRLRVAWSKCNPSSPVASPLAPRGYKVRRLDSELRGLSATRVHPLQALRQREVTECDAWISKLRGPKCNPSSPVASPSAPRGYRVRRQDCELRGLVQPEFTRCEPFGTERLQIATPRLRVAWSKCNPSSPVASPSAPRRLQSATPGLRVAWYKCNLSSPVASPSAPRGYRVRRLDCELRGLSATRVHPLRALRHREVTDCDASTASCVV